VVVFAIKRRRFHPEIANCHWVTCRKFHGAALPPASRFRLKV
jgi:hypothetical protein